jgi:hypothetical protein
MITDGDARKKRTACAILIAAALLAPQFSARSDARLLVGSKSTIVIGRVGTLAAEPTAAGGRALAASNGAEAAVAYESMPDAATTTNAIGIEPESQPESAVSEGAGISSGITAIAQSAAVTGNAAVADATESAMPGTAPSEAAVFAAAGSAAAPSDPLGAADESEPVLRVAIPARLDFTIDPFELAGRGQVYSEPVEFANFGESDVTIAITDISVKFANDMDFEAVPAMFGDERISAKKAICLQLNIGSCVYPVPAPGEYIEPIAFELGAHASGKRSVRALAVSGAANPYPDVKWNEGDVRINLTYKMEPADVYAKNTDNEEEQTNEPAKYPERAAR